MAVGSTASMYLQIVINVKFTLALKNNFLQKIYIN